MDLETKTDPRSPLGTSRSLSASPDQLHQSDTSPSIDHLSSQHVSLQKPCQSMTRPS